MIDEIIIINARSCKDDMISVHVQRVPWLAEEGPKLHAVGEDHRGGILLQFSVFGREDTKRKLSTTVRTGGSYMQPIWLLTFLN